MIPQALILGVVLGIGLWIVMLSVVTPPRPDLAKRLAPYLLDVSPRARELNEPAIDNPAVVFGYLLSPWLQSLSTRLDGLSGGGPARVALLARAGSSESSGDYAARRGASGVLGFAVGFVAGFFSSVSAGQAGVVGGFAGALVGFIAGLGWVDYRLKKQIASRVERITEEFPTIIELLGLALAAGDSLPRALARVARRSQGELGQEWARVMTAVELGAPLGESLRDSATRVGGPEVIAFVEHLAQALDRGAPLGEVVAAHAKDAKEYYTRALVDRAGKAEVQMLVPMVLLILPVTVIFAVYPGLEALQFGF